MFHKITAHALLLVWVGKRARPPDLQLGMTFLCTRVIKQAPNHEHNYMKPKHHMMYLQTMAFLPLILKLVDRNRRTNLYQQYQYIIDAGVHTSVVYADTKGQRGVYVTMGTGAINYTSSTKCKINTAGLTEAIYRGNIQRQYQYYLWSRKHVHYEDDQLP